MLDKIFNRKYCKAIQTIEEAIEFARGQEDYYKAELRMGMQYKQAKDAVYMADWYEKERKALENVLRDIKSNH